MVAAQSVLAREQNLEEGVPNRAQLAEEEVWLANSAEFLSSRRRVPSVEELAK